MSAVRSVLGAFAIDSSDHLALNPDLYGLVIALSPQELHSVGHGIGIRSSFERLDSIEPVRSVYEETDILGHAAYWQKVKNK